MLKDKAFANTSVTNSPILRVLLRQCFSPVLCSQRRGLSDRVPLLQILQWLPRASCLQALPDTVPRYLGSPA